jgi:hypothetical protein
MDRKLARRNIWMGVSMLIVILGLLGVTFAWAALFLAYNH